MNKKVLDDDRDIKVFLNTLFRGIDVNYNQIIEYILSCYKLYSPNDFDRFVNIMSLDDGIIAHKLSKYYKLYNYSKLEK